MKINFDIVNADKIVGYEEAQTFDAIVNVMLKEHPITLHNADAWMKFSRTVKTTMHILEKTASANLRQLLDMKYRPRR